MPEGDSLHRVARRLQVLVGERVEAESPNPRGLATGVARAVDGRVLERVDAVGKNVLLHFEGGVVVRSHLRMNGRWRVRRRGDPWRGVPWLVLRGAEWEATQWNGPVLQLGAHTARGLGLGPDLLAPDTDPAEIVARLRRVDQSRLVGEALVDQRVVAGIGNMWLAEALWHGRISPWSSLADVSDNDLQRTLAWVRDAMRASVGGRRSSRAAYRRAGRGCPRCGEPIRSRGLGDANRTAYWCPACQPSATEREGFEPSTSGLPPVTP
jgi:endonuclease VIII